MWQAVSGNPFFTVALPIIMAMFLNGWWQNKRIDDLKDAMNHRFDAVDKRFDAVDKRLDQTDRRLERIETKLDSHTERNAKLEGPALVHG